MTGGDVDLTDLWQRTLVALGRTGVSPSERAFVGFARLMAVVEQTALIAVPNDYTKKVLESDVREHLVATPRVGSAQNRHADVVEHDVLDDAQPLAACLLRQAAAVVLVLLAVVIDPIGAFVGGGRGWFLSVGHFVERHGLIVIIAIGESLIALGLAASAKVPTAGVMALVVMGALLASLVYLLYFRRVAPALEAALERDTGLSQVRMARDVYSYGHLLVIGGIVAMGAVAARWGPPALGSHLFSKKKRVSLAEARACRPSLLMISVSLVSIFSGPAC